MNLDYYFQSISNCLKQISVQEYRTINSNAPNKAIFSSCLLTFNADFPMIF